LYDKKEKREIRCLSSSDNIGQCLVDAAVRAGAGLLVMGGYSHSRAREFVLGCATHYMLEASDFPVLIVH
jgi:nucleotide-binding universal stress UspA family protein